MAISLSSAARAPVGSLSLLLPLFFVSGFPALVYQLVWQRALYSIYGINIEAVTVVVSGFLLGLGLGSVAGGRLSSLRSVNLLGVFGVIELGLAAVGFFSLDALQVFGERMFALPTWALTCALLALLVVPTTLMGATLPILVAHLVRRSPNVGRSVGLLYFVNTLGSSVACIVAGLWLMRSFGMRGSVNVAATLNLLVAVGAFAGALGQARRPAPVTQAAPIAPDGAVRRDGCAHGARTARMPASVLLAALTGYLALSYEMVWFRAFSLATGTAWAFALVLGAYLAGTALGSLRARELCERTAGVPGIVRALAVSLASAAALGFALLPLASHAGALASPMQVLVMLLLVMVHAGFTGLAFPLISHLGVPPDARAGLGVSVIYLANIAGAVAGTLVTGFVAMDHWGLAQIIGFLTGFGAVLAAALVPWTGARSRRSLALAMGAAAVVTAALPAVVKPAFAGFFERLVFKEAALARGPFTATVENKSGVINVTARGEVYGGGFYDGRTQVDLLHDTNGLVRPAMLSFFHPAPANVLLIGLATGAWAQVLAANPQIERLTIVEINRGYRELIAGNDAVRSLLDNPKVEIVFDDARRWLRRNPDRRFDAVVQNTTWHFRSHVTNLLSAEYLDSVARHLRSGGVYMYNTTGSARAQRTACARFPDGVRYSNMMVVGLGGLAMDLARLDGVLREHQVDGRPLLPADEAGARKLDEILASAAMPDLAVQNAGTRSETCASILKRTAGMPLVTDDNMGEEW